MGCGLKLWVPWSKLHRNHTVFLAVPSQSRSYIPSGSSTGFTWLFQSFPKPRNEIWGLFLGKSSVTGDFFCYNGMAGKPHWKAPRHRHCQPNTVAKHGGFMVELIAMINGHCRNRLIGGTDSIYKAYFLGKIPRKYGLNNGTFTYLHLLDPGFPIDVMWFLIAHW